MAFQIFTLLGKIVYEGDEEVISSLKKTDRLAIKLDKNLQELGRTTSRIGQRMAKTFRTVGRRITGLQGLVAGAGAGFLVKSFIDASSAAEGYRTRLDKVLGSQEESNRLFADMQKVAGRVPQAYEEIMASATALAGIMEGGREEVNKWIPVILDLAAVAGLSLEEATSSFIKMYSSGAQAAELLKERGITAMLGFKAGVSFTAEETRKQLFEEWEKIDSKFRGTTEDMSDDWTGLVSMMGDRWFTFREKVGRAGLFDTAKLAVQEIIDKIDELEEKGELDRFAQGISNAILEAAVLTGDVLIGMGKAIEFISKNPLISEFGLLGFFLLGTKGAVTLAAVGAILEEIIEQPQTAREAQLSKIAFLNDQIEAETRRQEILLRTLRTTMLPAGRERVAETLAGSTRNIEKFRREIETLEKALREEVDVFGESAEETVGFGGFLRNLGEGIKDFSKNMLELTENTLTGVEALEGLVRPPAPDLPTIPGPELIGEDVPERALTLWELIGVKMDEMAEKGKNLSDVIAGTLTNSFQSFGSATRDAFSSMITGSENFGRALLSGLLDALSEAASAQGQFYLMEAAGAFGEFLAGKNPKGLAAAAKLTAAGLGMMALAGIFGGGGSLVGAGGGAGVGGAGSSRSSIPGASQAIPPTSEINIWIDPFDPSNPVHQDRASEAVYRYGERGGRFNVNVREGNR